jgi:hypothetical protein
MCPRVQAAARQQREEAEGLAEAAQGDVKGAVIKGGIKEAVQAGIQEGGLADLVVEARLEVTRAGEMLDVAAEGGGAEAELGGQGAVGHLFHETQVDLGAGGVRADGTAFYHNCALRKGFPPNTGWVEITRKEKGRARTGETVGRKKDRRREALRFPALQDLARIPA